MNRELVSIPELLKEYILKEGKVLGNGILKVDSFMNRQINPALHMEIGRYFAELYIDKGITKILTLESSGIAPAFATAAALGVPMVFARKKKPITMLEFWRESAPSHTKGGVVEIYVSRDALTERDTILIVDDFLATGLSIAALARIVQLSGARLVGIAAIIEKTFEHGRDLLTSFHRIQIQSAVRITKLSESGIAFD